MPECGLAAVVTVTAGSKVLSLEARDFLWQLVEKAEEQPATRYYVSAVDQRVYGRREKAENKLQARPHWIVAGTSLVCRLTCSCSTLHACKPRGAVTKEGGSAIVQTTGTHPDRPSKASCPYCKGSLL